MKFKIQPVFTIIDIRVDRNEPGLPVKAYTIVEQVDSNGKEVIRTFKHIDSEIGAYEAEEVGVEHLLRDINDPSTSTLAERIRQKSQALKALETRLKEVAAYLGKVADGTIRTSNPILYNVQNILNLLPNLNLEKMIKSLFVNANDAHLVIYLSTMIRSVTALHDLVNNKIKYADVHSLAEDEAKEADAEGLPEAKENKKS